ncbi:MAG: B12-binding domain-containing radical SAM protein [Acidobacteria bacterium]|nr:MAG: B12-binding domain-containing radical SAM protein [Acidobacteriota bacterium]
MRGRVVLFFPSYFSDEAAPPLALIHLAAPLVANGYEVRIVDSAVTEDCAGAVGAACDGAVCLGISMVTGPMITQGVEVARAVRARCPGLPIVAGGWHASILPEQTLRSASVDAVVKGQGEITFAEIVDRYAASERDLGGIAGCLYKKDGEVVWNPDRGYTDINVLPPRPFHLIDFERYAVKCKGLRWLLYCTSHGCPWDCSYCSNASVYGRNWKPLHPETAVAEMAELAARYRLQVIDIIDDNYLVRRDRALDIAEGLLRGRARFAYYMQTRTDQVDRLSDEDLALLARSGLRRIFFGLESGSARVMRSVNKRLDLETAYRTAQRCRKVGIRPSFNLIFGLPAEEEEDLRDTLAVVDRIGRANPEADFFTNIFSPYPGSPIWPEAVRRGIEEPRTLEEWADFHPKVQVLPWLSGARHARIQRIRDYIRMGYSARQMVVERPTGWRGPARDALRALARRRLRSLAIRFPFEVWALRAYKALRRVPAPAVIN